MVVFAYSIKAQINGSDYLSCSSSVKLHESRSYSRTKTTGEYWSISMPCSNMTASRFKYWLLQ